MYGPICVMTGGDIYRLTDRKGKQWTFEMHPYSGPGVVHGRTLELLNKQPGPRSEFWNAVDSWVRQGKKSSVGMRGIRFCEVARCYVADHQPENMDRAGFDSRNRRAYSCRKCAVTMIFTK